MNALTTDRPTGNVSFRLSQTPVLRSQFRGYAETLVDRVRDIRDGGAKRFSESMAAEDLFLDVYLPQLAEWIDAQEYRSEGWATDDSRNAMRHTIERCVAALTGLDPSTIFTAGLAFTPTQEG